MLRSRELAALRVGSFEIDCDQIVLRGRSQAKHREFVGPGYIRQRPHGGLVFRIYAREAVKPDLKDMIQWDGTQSGEAVAEDQFYDLEAVDKFRRRWTACRVDPYVDYRGNATVSGEISCLDAVGEPDEHDLGGRRLSLTVPFESDIPCNTVSQETLETGGELVRKSTQMDSASFAACGLSFRIRRETGEFLQIRVQSLEVPFEPFCEERICESLQLVLGQPVHWVIMRSLSPEGKRASIRVPRRDEGKARMGPPIKSHSSSDSADIWRLFECFLAYTGGHGQRSRPPLSIAVSKVQMASAGTVEAHALMLCVVIEGLLTDELANLAGPPEELPSQLENFHVLLEEWQGPDALKDRIRGATASWLSPHTSYCCKRLTTEKLISPRMVRAWRDLRNSAVHADRSQGSSFQDLRDRLGLVTVLFYHLVFLTVGYEGAYTDYGTHGYPTATFSGKITRQSGSTGEGPNPDCSTE